MSSSCNHHNRFNCGSDACRVSDNSAQEHYMLNGFFTLGNLDGRPAQGFRDDVPAPQRTKHRKEDGSAISTFALEAHPGAIAPRGFVNNSIVSDMRGPRQRTNGSNQFDRVEIPLFRTAVYKGNGPVAIGVESELRAQHSRGGRDKSCRTIMTKDFNRWERDLRFDPQAVQHVVHSAAGLPPRGGLDSRENQYDVWCQDDRPRVESEMGRGPHDSRRLARRQ